MLKNNYILIFDMEDLLWFDIGSVFILYGSGRTSSTLKHEISKKFLPLWVIFALLDPDSEYGSGSTDLIESGSNPDPDPKP